ncbi:DUF998 domain-containing protein [Lysobacter fragariae]
MADTRRLGSVALLGVVAFALVTIAAQFWRADLDWMRAPLSFYLLGDSGWVVKAAYFLLGASLMALGVGYYRALVAAARSGAPLLLFVAAGLSLDLTALADSDTVPGTYSFEAFVHGLAASAAFLCVTTAMMLQAWRLRGDAQWRSRFIVAFALAVACFVAMWIHLLWRDVPRGLTQKVVIALIIAWLALAARWLRGSTSLPSAETTEDAT